MWSSFYSGVEKSVASATPAGDFGIGPEQLVLMSKDHNVSSLKQYGGVRCVVSLLAFLYLIFFLVRTNLLVGNCIRLKGCLSY